MWLSVAFACSVLHLAFGSVRGSTSLFAANSDDTVRFVGVGPGRPNIIPCITNPRAQVSLRRVDDGAYIDLTTGDVNYDPRVGFSLLVPNVYYNGQFECAATLRGRSERRRFIVHYFAATMIPKPYITMSDQSLEEGNHLELRCRTLIASDTQMFVQWTKDGVPLEGTDRLEVSPAEKINFEHNELRHSYTYTEVFKVVTIPCLRMSDSGLYGCTVTDHNRHEGSDSQRITVRHRNPDDADVLCLRS